MLLHPGRGLLICLIVLSSLSGCGGDTPQRANNTLNLATKYAGQGNLDRAIKTASDWLKKHPNDESAGLFCFEIAMFYLQKASKDDAHREESLQNAVDYFEKDLAAHRSAQVDIERYEVGRGLEAAGDLTGKNKCLYYTHAIEEFRDEAPFILGESYTAYGKTISLAAVRQENEKALDRVKAKLTQAACK